MVDIAKADYKADPRLLEIRTRIAHKLGLPPDNVTVKVGRDPDDKNNNNHQFAYSINDYGAPYNAADAKARNLVITVQQTGMAVEFERYKEEMTKKLGEMQPFAKYAQMISEEQMAQLVKKELEKVVAGTNFNIKIINESPIFDQKSLTSEFEAQDYALSNVTSNAYGIDGTLHFPRKKGEDITQTIERFRELQQGREAQILKVDAARAAHYAEKNLKERGLNADEKKHITEAATKAGQNVEQALAKALTDKIEALKAKIHADMAKVKINWNIDKNGNLSFTARSEAQQNAYDAAQKAGQTKYQIYSTPPSNAEELSNSNPLTSHEVGLTTEVITGKDGSPSIQPQLKKLLARGLFFDENKNIVPDAVKVMGRADIKAAIATELMKNVLPKHPEKRAEIEAILNSDLFKNHASWHGVAGTAGQSKPKPVFSEPRSDDTVEISFAFPTDKDPEKNQLLQVVNGLAGLTMNSYNHTPPAIEDVAAQNQAADAATTSAAVAAAGATDTAAAAAAIAAAGIECKEGEKAVAGAVGAAADGIVGAAAGAACLPATPEVPVEQVPVETAPIEVHNHGKNVVVNGTEYSPNAVNAVLKNHGISPKSHTERCLTKNGANFGISA